MAQQANGSLPKLLTAFFSFLHRRTDFYCILPQDNGAAGSGGRSNVGFKEGQAEQILLATFRQFPLRRVGPAPPTASCSSKIPSSSQEVVGSGTSKATNNGRVPPAKAKKDEIESNKAKKKDVAAASAADVITKDNPTGTKDKEKATKPTTTATTANNNTKETTIRYTNDGKQIPIGNGGSTSRYVWTQTLEEVTVHIPIPNGTRAKDLHVKIDAHSLCVKRKDGDCAALSPLEGMFFARIRPDECTWTIESSSSESQSMTTLQLTLDKIQRTWWDIVISGDNPLIDTTMVDSSRHIDTYDDKTQAQIRRIIHDQRQERLGLSSDSLQVQGGSGGGGGKIPSMPSGVEYIDGETLDKATIGK